MQSQGLGRAQDRETCRPDAVAGYVFGAGAQIKDAFVLAVEPPPIEGLSMTGGFDGFVQSRRAAACKELEAAVQKLVAAASQAQGAGGRPDDVLAPACRRSASISIARKRRLLGVRIADVFDTLQSTFGALYVNDFNRDGRVFRVQLQSEAAVPRASRGHPQRLRAREDGAMVPLTALVTIQRVDRAGGHRALQRVSVGEDPR